jgi:hypothetical protein
MTQIVTGFGSQSAAADVAEGADLNDSRAVATGGTSRIGA